MRLWFFLLLALIVALAGCRRSYDRDPGPPLSEKLASSGTRVMINDIDGAPLLKVRRLRNHRIRLYDESMLRLGVVHYAVENEVVYEEPGGQRVVLMVEDPDVIEVEGRFRLERVSRGWALFDRRNELIGYLDHEEGEWTLRSTYSTPKAEWLARPAKDGAKLYRHGEEFAQMRDRELGAGVLLVMSIEQLSVSSRGLLAGLVSQGWKPLNR